MLFWITFGQLAHTKCTNAQMHKCTNAQMHKSLFSCNAMCVRKNVQNVC